MSICLKICEPNRTDGMEGEHGPCQSSHAWALPLWGLSDCVRLCFSSHGSSVCEDEPGPRRSLWFGLIVGLALGPGESRRVDLLRTVCTVLCSSGVPDRAKLLLLLLIAYYDVCRLCMIIPYRFSISSISARTWRP